MNSDTFFDDDQFDQAALEQLDAIEAAALGSPKKQTPRYEESYDDLTLNLNDSELAVLDSFIEDAYDEKTRPHKSPSRQCSSSYRTAQTTLFGDVLPSQPSSSKPKSQMQRTKSSSSNPFGHIAPKTKKWDHTAFAKSGLKRPMKDKGKERAGNESGSGEELGFEQFPAPFIPSNPPPPMKLKADLLEAKHWIYPLNRPKRDYQYNIVRHCLFENTLVALPTGLGKTFIAGVVMLNYYRWFPDGKVVFAAPTKPLVAQQIEACHQVCGIPGTDATELTGENSRIMRAKAWQEKRVFYMTPQTLINDLTSQNCDVRDIVLLVIDEAHKATGNHSYAQIIRFMMAKNPHFRILALTATPGSNPDKVQDLVDALHISRIEIRNEDSLDLRPYLHEKRIEQHIIKMDEDTNNIIQLLAKLMEAIMKPLQQRNILHGSNPYFMHPYYPQRLLQGLPGHHQWAYQPLIMLSGLARAMGYLIESSMAMCFSTLSSMSDDHQEPEAVASKSAVARAKKLRSDPLFQAVMRELGIQKARGFPIHPKMDRLKVFLVQHFGDHLEEDMDAPDEQTRAIVFTTYRECVEEIVECLRFERPLIRPVAFIGQGTDKQGNKGLPQKQQLEVIKKFKAGEYNVLVATCIGEEGLDIGEVDLIVCYDSQKTPIRMLQRIGRTGRKRAGVVHVLLAEGREEQNFDKAKDAYAHVQKTIWQGAQLELYGDVKRLLPGHIKPQCIEKQMEIVEYVRDDEYKRATRPKGEERGGKVVKRKRNDAIDRNIPDGAITGFLMASKLVPKKRKTAPIMTQEEFETKGKDDDSDLDIEAGTLALPAPRKSQSMSSATTKDGKSKKSRKLRRTATTIDEGTEKKSKARKTKTKVGDAELTSSQLQKRGQDDSNDMDIEQGVVLRPIQQNSPVRKNRKGSTLVQPLRGKGRKRALPSSPPQNEAVIRITDSEPEPETSAPPDIIDLSDSEHTEHRVVAPTKAAGDDMAWLVDDDSEPDIKIIHSSPARTRSHSPLVECSIEFEGASPQMKKMKGKKKQKPQRSQSTLEQGSTIRHPSPVAVVNGGSPENSPPWHWSSSPLVANRKCCNADMPPPELPARLSSNPPSDDTTLPIGNVRNRRFVISSEPDSPLLEMPPPSQRRLQRTTTPPLPDRRERKDRKELVPRKKFPLFDVAAIHSGDEVSEGSSHSEDDMESESDRLFLEELPETQVPGSYDQSLVYRQSLFTQAPEHAHVPQFKNRPARRGPFGGGSRTPGGSRRLMISSSPPRPEDQIPDEYAIGSFVVDDSAEISYEAEDSMLDT